MDFPVDFQSLRPAGYNATLVATQLNRSDYWGAIKVRLGIGRDHYLVTPGIYKVGTPIRDSDVFVSANYKLSFDTLRKNLDSINAWILVIDTKGINVWCAAGKGTFGTDNLVKSIKKTSLESFVNHRHIIIPQLGASGVAAHLVKKRTGFRVIFGPVHACDIKAFIQAGYKASPEMRKMTFPILQRAKLIPVDLMAGINKLLLILAAVFVLSGLDRTGFLFTKMLGTSLFPLINVVGAYLAGIALAPLFLPWIPFRAFALKGAFWGIAMAVLLNLLFQTSFPENIGMGFISLSIASFTTMNFTGSSTFTSLSGVKKEMKWAIPFQITFGALGLILFIISKLV